jgi:hypothetical protein
MIVGNSVVSWKRSCLLSLLPRGYGALRRAKRIRAAAGCRGRWRMAAVPDCERGRGARGVLLPERGHRRGRRKMLSGPAARSGLPDAPHQGRRGYLQDAQYVRGDRRVARRAGRRPWGHAGRNGGRKLFRTW